MSVVTLETSLAFLKKLNTHVQRDLEVHTMAFVPEEWRFMFIQNLQVDVHSSCVVIVEVGNSPNDLNR